jgi:formylglycine-generating enzyme required for sulfatase activity
MKRRILNIFVVFLLALCLASTGNAQQKEKNSTGARQEKEFTNSIGMQFVLIPAGSFMMGCNKDIEKCDPEETPQHRVIISKPFYMAKYEVTQEQWAKVMGGNPSAFKGLSNPVEKVSWDDTRNFIEHLSKMDGKVYRLPTEAEWEYAARAGSESAYFFGNAGEQLGQYAWYSNNSGDKTHSVGLKQPNAWGLFDMHGNVWEWCQDWFEQNYYSSSPLTDPRGPSSGEHRVLRGGSWGSGVHKARIASRGHIKPDYRDIDDGFRVVMSVH